MSGFVQDGELRVREPEPYGFIARDIRVGPLVQSQHVEYGYDRDEPVWRDHPRGGRMALIPGSHWEEALTFARRTHS